MYPASHKKSSWLAAALRFILPGLIALLLLPAPVHGASGQPPGVDQTSPWGDPGVTRGPGWGPARPRLPSAAGVRFLPANQSPHVSGDLADPGVYVCRRLAGICPRRGGRRGLAARCRVRTAHHNTVVLRCSRRTGRRCPRRAGYKSPGRTWCSHPRTAPGKSRIAAAVLPGNRRAAAVFRDYDYPSGVQRPPPRSLPGLDSISTAGRIDRRSHGDATWCVPLSLIS